MAGALQPSVYGQRRWSSASCSAHRFFDNQAIFCRTPSLSNGVEASPPITCGSSRIVSQSGRICLPRLSSREGGFAVHRGAADRLDQMPKRPVCHFGQKSPALSVLPVCAEQGGTVSAGALFTHPLCGFQVIQLTGDGIKRNHAPISPFSFYDHQADIGDGCCGNLQHTQRVTKHTDAVMAVKAAAFCVGDARIGTQCGFPALVA